ncbi:MAG: hypothetical protein K6G62_00830 [Eubacterium sp.]|nr:hypothetical protein [Eubacterium sp.]
MAQFNKNYPIPWKYEQTVCMNCLQTMTNIVPLRVDGIMWGESGRTGAYSWLNLCPKCYEDSTRKNPDLWNGSDDYADMDLREPGQDDFDFVYEDAESELYPYEDEVCEYLRQLPLAGQELFWNRFYVTNNEEMDQWMAYPGDWIKFRTGIIQQNQIRYQKLDIVLAKNIHTLELM